MQYFEPGTGWPEQLGKVIGDALAAWRRAQRNTKLNARTITERIKNASWKNFNSRIFALEEDALF